MRIVLLVLLSLVIAAPCLAKARYAGKVDMIREAEAIVVATVTGVEDLAAEQRGRAWGYRQKAAVKVERVLKGEAVGEILVHGMENFVCAQCKYSKGRFILFLLEVKNDTREVFVLDEWFTEGANLVITGLNAKHEAVYVTDFGVDIERAPAKQVRIAPGNFHRTAYRIEDRLKTLPADVRYVVVKWTGNVAGTRIPESGLSTSRYEVRKAGP